MEASNEIASRSTAQTVLAGLLALLILIFGVLLFVGGMQLAGIGGSWYYALAGAALLATSVFIWKRSSKAIWIYSALMLLSVAWALFESGLQPWSLMPRLVAPACLGLAIAAAVPRQAHESFHAKFSVMSISRLAIGLVAVAYLSHVAIFWRR
jgi:glucose dehydrogenase